LVSVCIGQPPRYKELELVLGKRVGSLPRAWPSPQLRYPRALGLPSDVPWLPALFLQARVSLAPAPETATATARFEPRKGRFGLRSWSGAVRWAAAVGRAMAGRAWPRSALRSRRGARWGR